MEKILERKGWVITIAVIFVIALPVITNILGLFPTPITKGNTESWISFFGSYFGGIVGGILGALIAFGIAKYQIDQQRKNHKRELFIKQLPVLIKIRLELEGIKSNFSNIKSIFIDNNAPIPIDITVPISLPEINLVEIGELSNIINAELQAELINIKYFHNDLVRSFAFDIYQNDINFQKAFSESERLNRKGNRSKSEELRLRELSEQIKSLHLKKESTLSSKEFYLKELDKNIKLNEKIKIQVEKIYKKAVDLSNEYDVMQD